MCVERLFTIQKKIVYACVTFLLCIVFVPIQTLGAAQFHAGFKTLGAWDAVKNMRLDMAIWYPSTTKPRTVIYAPWRFSVARNGRSAEGRFPLLLLSHDTPGMRFSHYNIARDLARSGFVVVAFTHKNDNMDAMPYLYTIRQILDRVGELRFALDTILNTQDMEENIDSSRIGILAFGSGATAALLVGGASLDAMGWKNFCKKTQGTNFYCAPWVKNKIQNMAEELPLQQNFFDARIGAISAVAPNYSMFFTSKALRDFALPLLLVEAERDNHMVPRDILEKNFTRAPSFLFVPEVKSIDFMARCPAELLEDLPDLCGTAPTPLREYAYEVLFENVRSFFLKNLGHPAP